MKTIFRILILVVSLAVLSAWTWRLNMPSLYRGGDALNMIEEFQAYGLNQTTMVVVGIFKVTCAIILLIGLKVRRFVTPAAFIMGLFMIAAVYFHISISDPLVPTLPSALMLIVRDDISDIVDAFPLGRLIETPCSIKGNVIINVIRRIKVKSISGVILMSLIWFKLTKLDLRLIFILSQKHSYFE